MLQIYQLISNFAKIILTFNYILNIFYTFVKKCIIKY